MASRFPFPSHPNGWFMVASSDELPAAGVRPLRYFGRELVLYRGESGLPYLLDAHCPHLGAHLGHGGTVCGDRIQCPFHGWSFTGDGRCAAIPYAKKIPPKAQTRPWPVREVGGVILAYHHAHGESPTHEPVVPEPKDASWTEPRWTRRTIRSHVQEFAENSVDTVHFGPIHGLPIELGCDVSVEGETLRASLRQARSMEAEPRERGQSEAPGTMEVRLHGLGLSVADSRMGSFESRLVCYHTPIDDECFELRLQFQVERAVTAATTSLTEVGTLLGILANLDGDAVIWENKVYRDPPLLCEGESAIATFRRWARQFYSPRVSSADASVDVVASRRLRRCK